MKLNESLLAFFAILVPSALTITKLIYDFFNLYMNKIDKNVEKYILIPIFPIISKIIFDKLDDNNLHSVRLKIQKIYSLVVHPKIWYFMPSKLGITLKTLIEHFNEPCIDLITLNHYYEQFCLEYCRLYNAYRGHNYLYVYPITNKSRLQARKLKELGYIKLIGLIIFISSCVMVYTYLLYYLLTKILPALLK